MKSPKKLDTMGKQISAMRDMLRAKFISSPYKNDIWIQYLCENMSLIEKMLNVGGIPMLSHFTWKELVQLGGMHTNFVVSELNRKSKCAEDDKPTESVKEAIDALKAAEEACRKAYALMDYEKREQKNSEELLDDSGKGHVYYTFTEYGDVEYDSYKDMVEGTKAYCTLTGTPFPEFGMSEGQHYDFYESREEYEDLCSRGEA